MGTPRSLISIVFGAVVLLLVAASCSSATTPTETVVVGSTECLDCAQKNIKSENAAKGLRAVIKCKVSNVEKYETKSVGAVDGNGNFNVKLPSDLLQSNGELKQECFMQLHSAPNAPCPDKNGLTSPSSKLILKSKGIFGAAGKLSFASATCVSATFLPHYYKHPWHKKPKYSFPPFHFPHLTFPPKPDFHHHYPIYTPTYKPPYKPPSGGYYKPPTPTYKPAPPTYKPPSGGYYNPPTPTYKPAPPTYKPPSGGYYNPPTPTYKPAPSGGYYPGHPHTEANQNKP
ncbi:proline-rich protein 2-like [Curcuma longa]|uniref:proline-rich protein 2-like n=1 Tax=Curcuma longa TaxID=136217 RepID=UPI003D9F1F5B